MLSSALRVGHKPVVRKKVREKGVESGAPKQAPAPVQLGHTGQRPINWKYVVLGTAAVGAHLYAVGLAGADFVSVSISRLLSGEIFQSGLLLGFEPGVSAVNTGILLSLGVTGALFFKRQQRVPMLLNALAWIILFDWFPTVFHHAAWPCIVAAIATLAVAVALGRPSQEPEAPIK